MVSQNNWRSRAHPGNWDRDPELAHCPLQSALQSGVSFHLGSAREDRGPQGPPRAEEEAGGQGGEDLPRTMKRNDSAGTTATPAWALSPAFLQPCLGQALSGALCAAGKGPGRMEKLLLAPLPALPRALLTPDIWTGVRGCLLWVDKARSASLSSVVSPGPGCPS